ncbi:MAG: MarR family winged helix-turn-helix transcriptional regulator [Planctomycetes bacterium]|nr:MarR family winged helix-turn-helix transcriptional regulator [Planctomycetota bacterium]
MQPSPRPEPVGLLIGAARRRLRQASVRAARRFGLPPQQFWVLVIVLESDGPSLRALAARTRMDAPTTSRTVASLVRRKLVRVEDDPADGRRSRIVPTAAALRRQGDLAAAAESLRSATIAGFSSAEADLLRDGLRRVIDNLERFRPAAPATRRRAGRTA